jgi:uncharacterized protein
MLLLTSFTVENFRGIRQGTVNGLTDVNVIIGRNNSGKTTLLEAMHRGTAFGMQNPLIVHDFDYWRAVRGESPDEQKKESFKAAVSSEFRFAEVSGRSQVFASRAKTGIAGPRTDVLPTRVGIDPARIALGEDKYKQLVSAVHLAGLNLAKGASAFRPPDGSNTAIEAKLWPQLLTDRSDKRLAAALNEVFGTKAESFQLLPSGKLIVLFENHSVPLDAQGDGTRAAMRCLMLLTALRQTLFIVEEPECHQHPGSLEKFALAVCKLAKQNEVQLMISTHSGECVRAFLKAAEAAKSEGAVFHLSLNDGIQTARRLDAEAVETLQNTGIDVRFLDLYS